MGAAAVDPVRPQAGGRLGGDRSNVPASVVADMIVTVTVDDVMQSPVESVAPEATLGEAAAHMDDRPIGSVVVVEDGEPVGILTEADVVDAFVLDADRGGAVTGPMSSPVTTIELDTTVDDAAALMRETGVSKLPVVDDGELVGIVTAVDLSYYIPALIHATGAVERSERRRDVRPDTAYEDDDWAFESYGPDDEVVEVGDSVEFSKTIDAADVEAFAEASGDTNRLHLDADYAAETRFGERIAHGTLVAGTISAALARLPGLTIYLSQETAYQGPVPIDDRVTADCEVVEDLGKDRYRLTTRVEDGDGETVIDGDAVVLSDPVPDV